MLGLVIGLGLAFSKDLCDNNAHHKLVYNIPYKFDGGASAYNKNCQRLPVMVYSDLRSLLVDWRSVKLQPRSSVAVVAIAKAAVSLQLSLWRAIVQTGLVYWLQSV